MTLNAGCVHQSVWERVVRRVGSIGGPREVPVLTATWLKSWAVDQPVPGRQGAGQWLTMGLTAARAFPESGVRRRPARCHDRTDPLLAP
jgi:hypothetical protein